MDKEISISVIQRQLIKPTDVLLVHVEIGNMAPSRVIEHITEVKNQLKKMFTNDIVMAAARDGKPSVQIDILESTVATEGK